jgi:hypothetical protein
VFQDGVVGMVTLCALDGLLIEFQWCVRFSVPVQTYPESHPSSLAVGIGSSIVEVASSLEAVPLPPLCA